MANDWSSEECRLIVADYFDMLRAELSGVSYSKTKHRKALSAQLMARTDGSIEYKHQNISAILIEMGHTYIAGYKPASNYQSHLITTIGEYLNRHERELVELVQKEQTQLLPGHLDLAVLDWKALLTEAPHRDLKKPSQGNKEFIPKRYNYSEREVNNRRLGELGEQFVLKFEKARLASSGKKGLVADVEWTSKEKGDGAGFDIRSFNLGDESPLYIEVKTTNSGKHQPFYISANELNFAQSHEPSWSLYRVFGFRSKPKLFTLSGSLSAYAHLEPTEYRADFRG